MLKEQRESRQELEPRAHEKNSEDWEESEGIEDGEGSASEQKIEDLHLSLERLRSFLLTLPQEAVPTLPTAVSEYCDRMIDYRMTTREDVLLVGQRRLNKMLRNKKIKRNWNGEDISLLVWLVSKRMELRGLSHFAEFEKEDWEFIASLISGSNWQKCKFRWLSLKKVKLVTNKWSKQQSKLLTDLIAENSKINWKLISEQLYERNHARTKAFRTAKQCREHWNCFLNPNIQKGPWTVQEDRKLLEYVLQLQGSKKWSEISKFMEGRTQNALKNRFNLLMNHQRKLSGTLTEKRLVKVCLNRLMLQQGHQQHLGTPPPLTIAPQDAISQHFDSDDDEEVDGLRHNHLIVPQVEPVPQISQQLAFGSNFNSFYSYVPSSMGLGSGNPVFFIIPNQIFRP